MKPDFSIQISKGKPYTILQLTDMQVINEAHREDEVILASGKVQNPIPEDLEIKCFRHIRRLLEKETPDLILITGDIVYGCFDHNTLYTRLFIEFMESLGIPWTFVFGNHDRPEYKAGIDALCRLYEEAPNCIYKRGNTDGESNFTIGLYEGEELVRIFYMMDSEGFYESNDERPRYFLGGFSRGQIYYFADTARALNAGREFPVPGFFFSHNTTADADIAAITNGYIHTIVRPQQIPAFIGTKDQAMKISPECEFVEGTYPEDADKKTTYLCIPPKMEGDFGFRGHASAFNGNAQTMEVMFNLAGIDAAFAGHKHTNSHILHYNNICYVEGVKCGLYDPCGLPDSQIGGTKITIHPDRTKFSVEQIYMGN